MIKILTVTRLVALILTLPVLFLLNWGRGSATNHDMEVKVYVPAGGGTVTSSPTGINCPADCQETYPWGAGVELIPAPSPGRTFLGWVGICYSPNCTFYLSAGDSETIVEKTANFGYVEHTVNIAKAGDGSGTVSGSGFSCGNTCSRDFANGSTVSLTATAATGSKFDGWGSSSSGGGLCTTGGKGSSGINTSPTCDINVSDSTNKVLGTATARFSLIAAVSTQTPTSSRSNVTQTAEQPTSTQTPSIITNFALDGQEVKEGTEINFTTDQPISISGKTMPNAKVKLYIFSDPKIAEVTANAEGVWSYMISGLEPGEHRIEAEVTDPITNQTSARQLLSRFGVLDSKLSPTLASDISDGSGVKEGRALPVLAIFAAGLTLLVLAATVIIILRRRNPIILQKVWLRLLRPKKPLQ